MEPREVLTTNEAAELLRLSLYTIRDMARRGVLPARKVGREWRFPRNTLMKWIEGEAIQEKALPELHFRLPDVPITRFSIRTPQELEHLSPDDLDEVKRGIEAIRRGDYVKLKD
ncbi:MAG: helix-turn-helix domain-containing protein [Acidobacteriia bacterium]|nr:helix-turn-helix domain-containing protein [Terriglobia bacterium]